MPLGVINRLGHVIGQAVRAIYLATPIKRTVESGLAFLQAYGHGDVTDATNQELLQEADLKDVQHFGFEGFPVMDGDTTYVIVDADGGLVAIASSRKLPTALADLVAGESRIYGQDDQSVLCKTGGDIECEPGGGKKVKVGDGAASVMVLDGDDCISNLTFDTWALAVETGIAAAGGGAVGPWGVTTSLADVLGSSTKGTVE
ncbi:MAG: hypothetical protein V3W44_10730 [Dehalococcoidales bacterium]